MNKAVFSQVVRSFLPELAIGSACCAAGYFFLVDPLVGKLAAARAEVDALNLTITKGAGQPPAADAAKTAFARRALDAVAARSSLAGEQARLLQAVSTLADNCRVRIEQFNPASPRGPRPAPGQSPTKPDARIEQRTAMSISFSGSFADTARFVQALQQEVGFTTVRALRMAPTGGATPDAVSVTVDTEHLSVNTKALAAAQPPAGQQGTAPQQQQANVPVEQPR